MKTKKADYLEAKRIVGLYEQQQFERKTGTKYKFHYGEKVKSTKGGRHKDFKPKGVIVGFGFWRDFPAIKVMKKNEAGDPKTVLCLEKNLVKV